MKYRPECNEVRAVLLGCLCLNDRVRRYADNALFPEERPCGERLFAELYYPHAAPQGSRYLFEKRLPRRRRAVCNKIEAGQPLYAFHSLFANIMIIPRAAIVRLTACAAFSESIIRLSALKCSTMNLPIE